MNIYTYYESIDVPGFDADIQLKMIACWQNTWLKYGWTPIVLTVNTAKQHPYFEEYMAAVSKLPTMNPPAFEAICFRRWLAMIAAGGGWLSDYDVLNNGFAVREPTEKLTTYQDHVPSLVSGSTDEYRKMVKYFIANSHLTEYQGKAHISDMLLIQGSEADTRSLVLNKGGPHWESAPLVHFTPSTLQEGEDRLRVMQQFERLAQPSEAVDKYFADFEKICEPVDEHHYYGGCGPVPEFEPECSGSPHGEVHPECSGSPAPIKQKKRNKHPECSGSPAPIKQKKRKKKKKKKRKQEQEPRWVDSKTVEEQPGVQPPQIEINSPKLTTDLLRTFLT